MSKNTEDPIILVGAGLAGSLMATYLSQQGFKVEVFEKREDMRTDQLTAGLSINLALSPRGIRPLEEIGAINEIMEIAIPMKGRMIHALDGSLTFQPYGKDEHEVINSVSRSELNKKLMDYAERGNLTIHFNESCVGFDTQTGEVEIENTVTGERRMVKGQTVIAADGAGSAVRYSMQRIPRFNYSQNFLPHGYKELTIPPGPNGEHLIEKNALHIWPRGTYMLIALANPDGSFTVTLFLPYTGEYGFDNLTTDEVVKEFFESNFPDAVPLMPTLIEDFKNNPTGLLGTIRCDPWHLDDKALLIGDAAHAIVPFYGQGMNAAFEDCRILNDLINKYGSDWKTIYPLMTDMRKHNANAIADLALDNFIEMRDRVADDHFLLMKQAEMKLYETYPDKIKSKYSMVTFSHMPYREAKEKGEILLNVVAKHCQDITNLDDFNIEKAYEEVMSRYTEWESKNN